MRFKSCSATAVTGSEHSVQVVTGHWWQSITPGQQPVFVSEKTSASLCMRNIVANAKCAYMGDRGHMHHYKCAIGGKPLHCNHSKLPRTGQSPWIWHLYRSPACIITGMIPAAWLDLIQYWVHVYTQSVRCCAHSTRPHGPQVSSSVSCTLYCEAQCTNNFHLRKSVVMPVWFYLIEGCIFDGISNSRHPQGSGCTWTGSGSVVGLRCWPHW